MQKQKTSTFRPITIIAASLCALYLTQQSPAASILGWGSQRLDSTQFLTNRFTAIAAGGSYSLALRSDGTIVGWGADYYGQTTPPAGNDFTAIAPGHEHSLALERVCRYVLAGDLNDDCDVDFDDFAQLAENWLTDCHTDPNNPACIPK